MSEEEDGSGSELSCSPSSRGVGAGSDLFKTVLEDYIVNETRISKTEFERYKQRLQNSYRDEEHDKSRRCESCQSVVAFCKCDLYHGDGKRKFGHRVHWADEVWNKPLTTLFREHDSDSESGHGDTDEVDGHSGSPVEIGCSLRRSAPKPILRHRATCIVIVSD